MIKNLLSSIFILLPFVIISIATSQRPTSSPVIRSYTITSNCSNDSLISGTVVASDDTIITPEGITYLNIGLPIAHLIVGADSSLSAEISPALTRTCLYSTMAVGATTNSIYTCSDNFIPACVVTLTPL